MEERRKKLTANKGSADGRAMSYDLGIPTTWITRLGVTENNRNAFIYFDEINNEIIIEKDPMPQDAAKKADIIKEIETAKERISKNRRNLRKLKKNLKELE